MIGTNFEAEIYQVLTDVGIWVITGRHTCSNV